MSETVLPEYDKSAFNCPNCGAYANQNWLLAESYDKYTAEYGGRTVYPHLFSFILAPAASGKGALQSSKELADKYHEEVLKN